VKKPVFVTTSVYALAHQVGMRGAVESVAAQLDSPREPANLPVVRTIERLRHLAEVHLHVDAGATYIGMARTRAFHEAYKTGLPWVMIDDDIDCTLQVCSAMLEVLEEPLPRLVITPYLTRDTEDPQMTMTLPLVRSERQVAGARMLRLPRGTGAGMGFVGMNRAAMDLMVAAADVDKLTWFDGGEKKLALFYDELFEGLWYGEDNNFFRKHVPSDVTVEAILSGIVVHGGVPLDLSKL